MKILEGPNFTVQVHNRPSLAKVIVRFFVELLHSLCVDYPRSRDRILFAGVPNGDQALIRITA